MILGSHVSIAGGIKNAIKNANSIECEAFQIFTKNQTQWKEKNFTNSEIDEFISAIGLSNFDKKPLASHDSYLINLCAPDEINLEKSRTAFLNEIKRCTTLEIPYLIFHPGSHLGQGEEKGIQVISESLIWAIENSTESKVKLLLETTAGQGTNIGYRFEHLRSIIEKVNNNRMGVCVDTCHIFAAGYDIRDLNSYNHTMNKINDIIGLNKIKAFHLNDSKKDLGSRVDRHQRIGEGFIGEKPFKLLVNDKRFENISGFLEIPGGEAAFRDDIRKLKSYRE